MSDKKINAIKLISTAFNHNNTIPPRYTCDGQNISPPLTWSPPPADTQSLALICDDPDAPGKTWVHWVVYNLPPSTRSLPEATPEVTVHSPRTSDRYLELPGGTGGGVMPFLPKVITSAM